MRDEERVSCCSGTGIKRPKIDGGSRNENMMAESEESEV